MKLKLDPRLLKRILMGPKYAHWNNAEIGSHLKFELNNEKLLWRNWELWKTWIPHKKPLRY